MNLIVLNQLLATDLGLVLPTRTCDECPAFGSDEISPRRRATICPAYKRGAACWYERNRLPLPNLTTLEGRADATNAYLQVAWDDVMLRFRIEAACSIDTSATLREMVRRAKLVTWLMKYSWAANAGVSPQASDEQNWSHDGQESTDR